MLALLLLFPLHCCLTSTETVRIIRDVHDPLLLFTQLLGSVVVVVVVVGGGGGGGGGVTLMIWLCLYYNLVVFLPARCVTSVCLLFIVCLFVCLFVCCSGWVGFLFV